MRATIARAPPMRLQRYLLRELVTAFLLIALLVTGVLFSFLLLRFLHDAAQLELTSVIEASPYILAFTFPITLPLSFLVACLLTYGRFAEENEFLALQMGGIHPWRAVAPAAVAAAALSIFVVRLNTDVIPLATLAKKEILRGEVRQLLRTVDDPGREEIRAGDFQMSWRGRDERGLADVLITWNVTKANPENGTLEVVPYRARAARARLDASRLDDDFLALDLDEFEMQVRQGRATTTVREAARRVEFDLDDIAGTPEARKSKGVSEMDASQIDYRAARLRESLAAGGPPGELLPMLRRFEAEYWRRIATGLAPLAFAFVGAGLGLGGGKTSRMAAMLTAIVVALPVYYPLLLWGEILGREGRLPPALALNLGNLFLAAAGVWRFGRAIR